LVHGCKLEDNVLIGMGAIVMDHALVQTGSIVAAGAVVLENSVIESGWIWAGVPAEPSDGALSGVPAGMAALTRAVKLQEKAAKVGFDWSDPRLVLAKIREECDELEQELDAGRPEALADEIGDLLFAVANLARHAETDAEAALRGTNAKFERRFRHIESRLAEQGTTPAGSTLAEMDALWDEAKRIERGHKG
jgi:ATP diphosphatase